MDITRLTEGWLELESDPGLFMLLLEDFGVKNVQVEEIYDITKPFDGPVYGFIFLFRWIEERRSRRKVVDQNDMFLKEEEIVNNIFFAQQMVPNSCATHALLSVLLNSSKIQLGDTLSRLKAHTRGMTPENKGWAIGNTPELARAHNSHAMPQAKRCVEKNTALAGVSTGRYAGEAFHFVSFVPIKNRLFELDGLKPHPIDHGPCGDDEWTEKFRVVMTERLGVAGGEACHDIRFNLMALIPDRRIALSHKLSMLKTNRDIVVTALQQLVYKKKNKSKKLKTSPDPGSNSSLADSESGIVHDLKMIKVEDCMDVEGSEASHRTGSEESHSTSDEPMQLDSDRNPLSGLPGCSSSMAPLKLEKRLAGTDYSTPLTIQTSPSPSICSTDTSSEVGSAFNSPLGWCYSSSQNSPSCSKDIRKFVVIRVAGEDKMESPLGKGHVPKKHDFRSWSKPTIDLSKSPDSDTDAMKTLLSKYPVLREPHTFAPKDLLALLKNVETEIANCEACLKDENDKRNKYKIDDCRRTHNYDDFICTFLSMLAEQGKLADLVEQHLLLHKKPGLLASRIGRPLKKLNDGKKVVKKKKGKAKHRRRT